MLPSVLESLYPGCAATGLPDEAAPELLHFLHAKRAFPNTPLSPSLTWTGCGTGCCWRPR